jgi:hypothetical protein
VNLPPSELAELRSLLDALCEESITAEQVRRLEELVLTRPEAEAYYVQFMSLHADLHRHFVVLPGSTERSLRERTEAAAPEAGSGAATATEGTTTAAPVRQWRWMLWGGGLGLSGLAAGLLVALLLPRGETPRVATPPQQAEVLDDSVAVLLQAPRAVWGKGDLPTWIGAPLRPGWLRLKAGYAHIEFYSGATVILEGPAEFQLLSPRKAYCAQGKLRATVPPQAQGFTIGSPKFDLVDRGTEFGLQVNSSGKTEVHVFEGKVDLYDAGSNQAAASRKELTTGRGLHLDGRGSTRAIASDPAAFLTAKALAERRAAETLLRQKDWLAASAALRRDPDLLVYYPFQAEQTWNRTLLDQAGGRKQPHDGAIIGCAWGTGRWPGKQALEFRRVSDRVRFHAAGEFESVSLLAWVRVDGLPNENNSLMMADGWDSGGLHWQIGSDGKLILGVQQKPKGRGAHYHAPGAITPERFGHWLHLAVVYDRDDHRVTHYVDGRPVAAHPLLFDIPLRIGDAELGNWNIATHQNRSPIRFLSGCMDEFALFARALSDQEVERLYTHGRPPT